MQKCQIRRAKIYDIPAITRIEQETSSTPWSASSIANDVLKNPKAYVAVVELLPGDGSYPGDVIGYADMWIVAGEAQLNNIAVDERYRRLGLGRYLLAHMIDVSRRAGCSVMNLEVRKSNNRAISLYDKMGFGRTAVRPKYYKDNHEDAVLMDKPIGELEADYCIDKEDHAQESDDGGLVVDVEIQ